ncbi:hypothetical protein D3C76_1460250 [compost metagenome]
MEILIHINGPVISVPVKINGNRPAYDPVFAKIDMGLINSAETGILTLRFNKEIVPLHIVGPLHRISACTAHYCLLLR